MINLNFNNKESRKVKRFLWGYYEWGCDTKGFCAKTNMDKDVDKLVEGCDKYTVSDIKVHKTHGDPGTNLSKSESEEPKDIYKYRSFVGKLMWYTTKVGPDMENVARKLEVHMIHTGPEQ